MEFKKGKIEGVYIIKPKVFGDERGFFMETWREILFKEQGIDASFVQDNHSCSKQGTLRGLHYQQPNPQGKLVRVISGEVFDVAVDLRKRSATYGQWIGEHLSSDNKRMLWVPAGFAHGFYVTSELAELVYKCTDYYVPQHEKSIAWDDPDIGIEWPITPGERPILSEKDQKGMSLSEVEGFDGLISSSGS